MGFDWEIWHIRHVFLEFQRKFDGLAWFIHTWHMGSWIENQLYWLYHLKLRLFAFTHSFLCFHLALLMGYRGFLEINSSLDYDFPYPDLPKMMVKTIVMKSLINPPKKNLSSMKNRHDGPPLIQEVLGVQN